MANEDLGIRPLAGLSQLNHVADADHGTMSATVGTALVSSWPERSHARICGCRTTSDTDKTGQAFVLLDYTRRVLRADPPAVPVGLPVALGLRGDAERKRPSRPSPHGHIGPR